MTDNSLVPIDTLGATIKAHIAAGDKSIGKAEEHYKAAGIYLQDAKKRLAVSREMTWPAFLTAHCSVARSRADELIAIANGKTTLAEVRAGNRERDARRRARQREESAVAHGKSPGAFHEAATEDIDPESYERERLVAEFAALSRRVPIERIREAVSILRGEN
jgi:hypothetical protein